MFEELSKTPKHRVVFDTLPNDHEQDKEKPQTENEEQTALSSPQLEPIQSGPRPARQLDHLVL